MKKAFVPVVLLAFVLCGFGGPSPDTPPSENGGSAADVYQIDNFEDGDYVTPEWWKFDNIAVSAAQNSSMTGGDPASAGSVGRYSLSMKGRATNWYVGGVGTYFAKPKTNYSVYNAIQMDVFGNGPGSGTLKIELFDDDNGNWQVEQDPKKQYAPIYDDKLSYELAVNWKGWKRITLPFADFEDINAGVGDDIWNPDQKGGSGGFLQIQLIALGPKRDGNVNFAVDNIVLVK